ncbi:MAG: hypothetical protein IPI59_07895 [Sphingobacteriales bacterium]|jgi:hypothetical protein|nr:hypothetical protein [Sphingobacteriales bacterium]MBP9142020.1 hypothetical protein [Chitinophagales bacterium]MDA0198984.1 hypothetical protein [Bacteroidota bacterium]MBK6890020.1 hypothetical protein [Sphingobacteriales bacterium]MBK7527457.1 hypothetical protein [Sphingobacteriales bacterium]
MKNNFLVLVFVAFISIVSAGCLKGKCHHCTINNVKVDYCEDDFTDTEINAAETACGLAGGDWD